MGDDRGFQVVVVAVSEYADPPGALPSAATAERVTRRLAEWGGVELRSPPARTTAEAVRTHLDGWIATEAMPSSSFLYWVGHGWDDGDDLWLLTSDSTEPYRRSNAVKASEVADALRADWERRSAGGDGRAWTVAVFDCCGASVGISNIVHELTKVPARRPERLALLAVSTRGATFAGRFADQLEAALDALTPNDIELLVRDLLDAVADRLGGDAAAEGRLAKGAVLARTSPAAVVTMNLDALAELRRVVDELPAQVRSHFLVKAQGGEVGELAWYFSGREAETRELAGWLRSDASGLRVVTGEPGAGKSALLGHLVTLADGDLLRALQRAGLVGEVPADVRPPEGVFHTVLHLTGMRLEEALAAVGVGGVEDVLDRLSSAGRPVTVLADALDEAQEPERIAAMLLRRLAEVPGVKVLVGTRRSLEEGPDRPPPSRHELLDALGVVEGECLVVRRDAGAKAAYVRKRLAGLPHVDALATRITGPDQPFLFARLATTELLARPPLDPADPALDELLAGGYRGVFAHAVERLAAADPAARPLLRALAVARGRGLPRNGRVWATVAGVFDPQAVDLGEEAVDRLVAAAAPYLTLDGDGGQSVYRLAHQTFASAFAWEPVADASVATALLRLVEEGGGWDGANPYVVRHLPEYLALEPDRLEGVVTSVRWLARAFAVLGPDGLSSVLAWSGTVTLRPSLAIASRAVRRARVSLGYDPAQLAAQLHGRLHAERDPALRRLVAGLPDVAPPVWLRARTTHLRWQAELETTHAFPGKVRALAFGIVGERTVLAVGAGHDVYLWDPRTSRAATVLGNDGLRVTAVAVGHGVLATGAGYEGRVALRDSTAGARLAFDPPFVRASLAASGSLCVAEDVVVGAGRGGVEVWDAATGESLGHVEADWPAVAATSRGVVVAEMDHAYRLEVRELDTGKPIGPVVDDGGRPPTAIGVGEAGGRVLVAQAFRHGEIGVWDGQTGELVGRPDAGMQVRCLAIGDIDGRPVVAAAEETDEDRSLVVLREPAVDQPQQDWYGTRDTLLEVALLADGAHLGALTTLGDVVTVDPGTGALTRVPDQESIAIARRVLLVDDPSPALGVTPLGGDGPGPLHRDRPAEWPARCRALGVVGGRLTWGVGSCEGAVWLFDAEARKAVGGPFADVGDVVVIQRRKTSRPQRWVTGVALRGEMLARAYDGVVTLHDLATGRRIGDLEPHAYRALSVSLGEVGGRPAVATGGEGGVVAIWDLGSRRPAAQVTLDRPVTGVWLVRGGHMVVARTNDRSYHVFDVMAR